MNRKTMLSVSILLLLAVLTAACNSDKSGSADNGTADGNKETITISVSEDDYGARMDNYRAAFKALNEQLQAEGSNVEVVADYKPSIGDDELVLQAQAGQYRDVSMNSSVDIGWELDAGLIQPIDWLKESEVFKNVPENYWNIMMYQGHVYGAIQDIDASPMFVNKKALKQLGWSDADIEGLPDKVKNGQFTIDDMLNVAADAVSKGVTKYGLGCDGLDNICIQDINNQIMGFEPYDIDQSKMIVDKQGMTATYAFWKKGVDNGAISKDFDSFLDVGYGYYYNGEFMFYIGGTGTYKSIMEASGLSDADFEKWFYENNTFTLVPAGKKGGKPGSLSNPRVYFISAHMDEKKLPYVKRLVDLLMAPKLQMDHTVASGKLPVTKEAQQDPRFKDYKFVQDVAYMLDYTGVRPPHLGYPDFRDIYKKGIELIMAKQGTPEDAYKFFESNYKQAISDDQVVYR